MTSGGGAAGLGCSWTATTAMGQGLMISANRIWFVNRFFYPDHSATSQISSDLALHLARRRRQIDVIASRGVYDDPTVVLPAFEDHGGVAIHRVSRARFGRDKPLGLSPEQSAARSLGPTGEICGRLFGQSRPRAGRMRRFWTPPSS